MPPAAAISGALCKPGLPVYATGVSTCELTGAAGNSVISAEGIAT